MGRLVTVMALGFDSLHGVVFTRPLRIRSSDVACRDSIVDWARFTLRVAGRGFEVVVVVMLPVLERLRSGVAVVTFPGASLMIFLRLVVRRMALNRSSRFTEFRSVPRGRVSLCGGASPPNNCLTYFTYKKTLPRVILNRYTWRL